MVPIGSFRVLLLCLPAVMLASASPASAAPPPNDNFANATTLPSVTSATITGTNAEATTQAGEPTCCFTSDTVWYRWTAPKTGNYRVELCGSSFNTYLKVLKGTAVNALETVAENNDDPGCADGSRSRLTFIAFQGQRYELQVGSAVSGATGTISGSIALISPPNDFFADATALAGGSAAITGTNVGASTESGEPTTGSPNSTVWYRWTAPTTGDYRIELCGSDFDTNFKVFTGTAVNALDAVAGNNDAPGCGAAGDRSAVTFGAAANTIYSVQVGSSGLTQGTITGSIAPAAAPTLTLDLIGKTKQEAEKLRAKATCSVACTLKLKAKGDADGRFKSKTVTKQLPANQPTAVKVKFKPGVLDKIADEAGKATLIATATASGQTAKDTAKVKLKP